jgi:DNA mismatch repair protein MutS2
VPVDRTPPSAGDLVWVAGFNQRGTLLSIGADGKAQVQVGPMRTSVPMDALQRIVSSATVATSATRPTPLPASRAGGSGLQLQAREDVSAEIKLIGLRADDALLRLDAYVDQACLAGLSPFRVVHGKGTGALKRVVWEFLRDHPNVARYRHPDEEEGGTGATVVELRD